MMEVMNKTAAGCLISHVLVDSVLIKQRSVMANVTVHLVKMRLGVPSVEVIS